MEASAPTQEDASVLKQLRDGTLKEQFVKGAREAWVKRELRCISIAHMTDNFEEMREEVILVFKDSPTQEAIVREVQGVDPEAMIKSVAACQEKLLAEIKELRKKVAHLEKNVQKSNHCPR